MMNRLRTVARHQAGNLVRVLSGTPVSPTPISSMTLDLDDVELAQACLQEDCSINDAASVRNFERMFAEYSGANDAVSFSAGRVALSAALQALSVGDGDHVIVPAYTCVVVPNAIAYAGATAVYCDIELQTFGADIDSVRAQVTGQTKAIVVQHLYGLVSRDYDSIIEFARAKNIAVIEDCAHSTGARYRNLAVGLRGDVGFFSSEQSKAFNTTAGGIAITRSDETLEKLRAFQEKSDWPDAAQTRSALATVILNYYRFKHPQRWWRADMATLKLGHHTYISTTKEELVGHQPNNYLSRMSAPVARLGSIQIAKLESYNEKRREAAANWDSWCETHGLEKPLVVTGSQPMFLRYPILVDEKYKRSPKTFLKKYGVMPGDWFRTHLHPSSIRITGFPAADRAVAQCINLPCLLEN